MFFFFFFCRREGSGVREPIRKTVHQGLRVCMTPVKEKHTATNVAELHPHWEVCGCKQERKRGGGSPLSMTLAKVIQYKGMHA